MIISFPEEPLQKQKMQIWIRVIIDDPDHKEICPPRLLRNVSIVIVYISSVYRLCVG